jgi:DNA-binding GntR family transcriptional regulator
MMSDDPRTAPASGALARRLASARRAAANAEAIRLRFIDDVDMARLAPGSCLALDKIARSYGCAKEALLPVLDELQTRGLIKRSGVDWQVAPIERVSLSARMDIRLVIEQDLAEAAARNVSALNRQELAELVGNLQRAAVVGDIDGYMLSDRRLEKAIAAAAGLPETAERLFVIKREFRRAWCAHNRLRDLNVPAGLRKALVDALLAGKPDEARATVRDFIAYLRQSF